MSLMIQTCCGSLANQRVNSPLDVACRFIEHVPGAAAARDHRAYLNPKLLPRLLQAR